MISFTLRASGAINDRSDGARKNNGTVDSVHGSKTDIGNKHGKAKPNKASMESNKNDSFKPAISNDF